MPGKKKKPSPQNDRSFEAITEGVQQLCSDCGDLWSNNVLDKHTRFARMRAFYDDCPDEFITEIFQFCQECGQVWREVNSTYNRDRGWHWQPMTWKEFFRRHGNVVAKRLEQSPEGAQAWLQRFEDLLSETPLAPED